MRKLHSVFSVMLILLAHAALSQSSKRIDSVAFFSDEQPFEMVLSSDLKNLINKKMTKAEQPATVTMRFADSTNYKEDIRINTRGKFRLENCNMPPLMLNFKNTSSPRLRPLGKLKLVVGCGATNEDEQLIIKEYLAYKMYNMLTEKSFRVRLVKINYEDTRGKIKPYTQFGFLLEDVDDMARRNKCKEIQDIAIQTESTDRKQMTLVALFEYMIGNTDWSVPAFHNIKLIQTQKDPKAVPIAVPYDLNHTGFVNAAYAVPPEELGIESVKDRLYRGFPRSMEELQETIAIFNSKKKDIYELINNCAWLSKASRKESINYLDGFYKTIDNKNSVRHIFIDNARKE
ncbi:MAG TPA: hypothetical protein VFZ42_02840 [Chitinophagaceae bacterium]